MNTVPQDQSGEPMYGWYDLPWTKFERQVFKLQKRIYRASLRGDVRAVHKLQRLLVNSWSAKCLAVRRVTQDNRGKRTAGVDGVASLTPKRRLSLVQRLTLKGKAQPLRRVWIPKPGSKEEKRPLGIPTIHDRALQALLKLALEPEWEARFEPNSYGFRPGRSCHDAIQAIHTALHVKAKYVLDADIAKCFDRVEHGALLEKLSTSPTFRRTVKGWLEAGIMDGEELFPTAKGTPQGGVISPLLANVALHGLEDHIGSAFPKTKGGRREPWQPRVIRYADDVRRITRRWIPPARRRGSEDRGMKTTGRRRTENPTTSGSTAYPAAKANGDRSMLLKREMSEGAYDIVPQDPPNMVKAILLEAQSPAMEAYIPRLQRLLRGRHDRAIKSSSPEPSAWRAVRSDLTQGDGRDTYVRLETSRVEGMRDRPTGREAQGDGASVVLSGRESRPQGEGRQVLKNTYRRGGTRDA